MSDAPNLPDPRVPPSPGVSPELAYAIAARVTAIVAGLAALIARAFLKNPFRAPLIVPLWKRLTRAGQRFARVMDHLATNTPFPKPRQRLRTRPAATPPVKLPHRRAWLLKDLAWEAAFYTTQLETLLSDPEIAGLVAACPQAARILRPLAHMLGATTTLPKPPAIPRRTRKPAPPIPHATPLLPQRRPRLLFPRRISKSA